MVKNTRCGSGEDEFMVGGERIRGRIWAVGFVMVGVPSPVEGPYREMPRIER